MKRSLLSVIAVVVTMGGCNAPDSDGGGIPTLETADLKTQPPPSNQVAKLVSVVKLTSNIPEDLGARVPDPLLINGWGLAFAPGGPAWVSSADAGVARIYDPEGHPAPLTVTLQSPTGSGTLNPTGLVFNGGTGFDGDRFIFATENGVISGWQPNGDPTIAVPRVDHSGKGASYKGIALLQSEGRSFLYAADFAHGRVDVFDENYQRVWSKDGAFSDDTLPKGYSPFNVMAAGGLVFVTYALRDPASGDDVGGAGHGFINVFDARGRERVRLVSRGALNSPWGMAFAQPATGEIARMLVGNFGDGRINSYALEAPEFRLRARFEGALGDAPDHPITIDGLWGIAFGPGRGGFRAEDLYFAAGPNAEEAGLFGRLEPVTTPPPPPPPPKP
jgi:uncharacterized protein (TIGR03118 family)